MAEHKHGSMDTRTQQATFAGFVRMAIWVVAIAIGVVVFLALANA